MVGNEYIGVDAEYLKELEEKAKKFDFFEGYIKGVEVAFAFAEEIAKFAKTERTITIPKAHGRKQALQMIDEIEALADRKTEPTISKMEQVDEPTHNQHVQRVEYVGNDEKSRCWACKHFERMYETPISSDGSYCTYVVCTASECRYEPKDEPQTEREGE